MNAKQRKELGQRKFIDLTGSLSQNEQYIRRFFHLLNIVSPGNYDINTTATYSIFIEDNRTQMSVLVFGGKNPFRYDPF